MQIYSSSRGNKHRAACFLNIKLIVYFTWTRGEGLDVLPLSSAGCGEVCRSWVWPECPAARGTSAAPGGTSRHSWCNTLYRKTHACDTHAAHLTDLSRAQLVLLGDLPHHRVLQQLVRVSVASEPERKWPREEDSFCPSACFSRNASHFIFGARRQFTWTVVSLVSQMGCRPSEQCSWICRTRSSPAAPCTDGVPPVEGTARSYLCTCERCKINFMGSNFGSVTLNVQNMAKNFFSLKKIK